MKRILLTLALFALPAAGAADQTLKPDDFAYGIPLQTDDASSVYEADLPLAVYQNATRPDLGDVRVFNADGTMVPHLIASGGRTEEEMVTSWRISVFPLHEDASQSPDALSVMIRRGAAGTEVTEVNVSDPGASPKKIVAYLFSTADLTGPVRALTLFWEWTGGTFVLPATLEASDDLKSWRTVTDDAVISQLSVDEVSIRKNKIEFAPTKAAYLRLRLTGGEKAAPGFVVDSAEAQVVTGVKTAEREWLTVKGALSKTKPRAFDFDLKARVPVDRVELVLPEGNHVISADLFSADSAEAPNRSLAYSGVLYRLRQSGHEIATGPIRPAPNADLPGNRLWFLELRDDSTALEGEAPSLKVGWVPQKVVFVAQGKGPYLLAYGSGAARKPRFEVQNLFAENAGLERGKATAGSVKTLGGPEKLLPPPPEPPSAGKIWGKRLALAGMVLATLLLGWMAFRLARQTA